MSRWADRTERQGGWWGGSGSCGIPIFTHPAATTAPGLKPCMIAAAILNPVCCCCCHHHTGLTIAATSITVLGLQLPSMLSWHQAQNHCRCHRLGASHPYCHHCHPRPLLLGAWCGNSEGYENGKAPATAPFRRLPQHSLRSAHPFACPPGSPSSCLW